MRRQIKNSQIEKTRKSHDLWKHSLGRHGKQATYEHVVFTANNDISLIDFKYSRFFDCVFENCSINDRNFENQIIESCRFISCDMKESSFKNSKLINVAFEKCILRNSLFSYLKCLGTCFNYCDISCSNLENSVIENTRFFKSSLFESNFSKANLEHVGFVCSDLCKVQFDQKIPDTCDLDCSKWFQSDLPWWLGHPQQDRIILYEEHAVSFKNSSSSDSGMLYSEHERD
jgi:uncharacterized protein YjbI with pentapeptide repeats